MAQGRRKPNRRRYRARRERYVSPKTKWAIALSALAVTAIALLAVALVNGWIKLPEPAEKPEQTTIATQPAADTVIHIVAGGDVNVTDKVVASGGSGYDYSGIFLDVLPVLSGGDLTLANFEGNVCGAPYGSETESAPPQLLQALKNAGVDILQTANSKSITNGLLGLTATNDAIRAAGMQPLGTYADAAEFEQYQGFQIYEIQGVRVALVAFTKGMEGRNLPEGSEQCVNLLYTDYSSGYKTVNRDGITQVLKAAQKEEPDVIIAMLHWGSEGNATISTTQTKICALMAELGVDAIIGTHSHGVQKMGFDEETGMFVAYSVGDLLRDNDHYSVLLDLEITKDGTTGETAVTGFDYTPIYLSYAEDGSMQLLRIREAMAAYEDNYIGKVSDELYAAMKSALTAIENSVNG